MGNVKEMQFSFFEGANNAIGTLIMKFNSQEQLKEALEKQGEWLHISVD